MLCQPCSTNDQCGTGNFCVGDPSGGGACGTGCTSSNDCPQTFSCYSITGSNNASLGSACLPDNNGTCFPNGRPDGGSSQGNADSGAQMMNPPDSGVQMMNPPDSGVQQGPPDSGVPTGPDSGLVLCTPDTWSNYAQAFMQTNCLRCHTMYSDFNQVEADSARIRNDVQAGTMPKDTTLSQPDIARFVQWVNCDLPP
jgi:hypothetical protein